MIGRALCSLVALLSLASHGGELRVLSTVGERIALASVVDLRASPTGEAQRADELLFEAFGGEMGLVYTGAVEDVGVSEVWSPANRVRDFTPYLIPAADHGARAVLFVFIEENGDWSLHLVGIDGSLLEERFFAGSSGDVLPLVTAAATEGFHRRFPPVTEETSVAYGRLLIRCDGRGFTAAVDGNPVGVVPSEGLELRLSAGAHRLTVYNGDESPLETRFVSIVAEGLVVEKFFFGFDVESEEDDEFVSSCLFDVLFAVFCTPAESDDVGEPAWGPETDEDDDEVWGPTPDVERDDDDDDDDDGDGGGVWAPEP